MSRRPLAVLLAILGLLALSPPGFAVEASLHPLCVQQMVRLGDAGFEIESDRSLPASWCNRHYRKAPIDIRGDYYFVDMKPIREKQRPFYKYRVAGHHRDVAIVDLAESTGGPGVVSAIAFFQGWPVSDDRDKQDAGSTVTFAGLLEAGDRCNGGIAEAKMTSPSTLRLVRNLTSYDFVLFRVTRALQREKARVYYASVENKEAEPLSDKLLALEAYRDLDTAATSCIGTVTTEFNLDFGTAKLVSITLTRLNDKNPALVAKYKHQACFNRVVKAAVPSFPRTLDPDEVREVSEGFETKCLQPPPS